jgi:hypothetical protein
MGEVERIELQLSSRTRMYYIIGAIGLVAAAVFAASSLSSSGNGGEDQTNSAAMMVKVVSIVAAFGCAYLLWRIGRLGPGEIRLDDKGITIDTTLVVGQVAWENYERSAVFKKMGVTYLGIAIRDPQRFIDSRAGIESKHQRDAKLYALGNRISTLMPATGANAAAKLMGWKPMPTSGSEIEVLAWYRGSMGYDICILAPGVTGAKDIPARIDARRPADVVPLKPVSADAQAATAAVASVAAQPVPLPARATPAPPPPAAPSPSVAAEASYKTCPMCAEPVRAAAKICRFCGYKFESSGPVPA